MVDRCPGHPSNHFKMGSGKKQGQEDQGTSEQLGGVPPSSFTSPWSSLPFFWLFMGSLAYFGDLAHKERPDDVSISQRSSENLKITSGRYPWSQLIVNRYIRNKHFGFIVEFIGEFWVT